MRRPRTLVLTAFIALLTASTALAQMPRERSQSAASTELFWAPTAIVMPSISHVGEGMLDFTIHHAFGLLDDGANGLWGLDAPANIRFGFDYGVSDSWSVSAGRSRFNKTYDFGSKWTPVQKQNMHAGLLGNVGIETPQDGRIFENRLSFLAAGMAAFQVSETVVVQAVPGYAHFNLVPGGEENGAIFIGWVGRWQAKPNLSVMVEALPVVSGGFEDAETAFSTGVDLEVGGHVFQLFLTSTQWMTMQHAIFLSRDNPLDGDLRLGFNVHRVFGVR